MAVAKAVGAEESLNREIGDLIGEQVKLCQMLHNQNQRYAKLLDKILNVLKEHQTELPREAYERTHNKVLDLLALTEDVNDELLEVIGMVNGISFEK